MKNFELLKRTYPVSKYNRNCDGYIYILDNTTTEIRKNLNINHNKLQQYIKIGEKYIYMVAKENGEFRIMSICFENYKIIRNKLFKFDDD